MSRLVSAPPPRAAVWLLNHLCPATEREPFIGDLLEEFAENLNVHGARRARRHFWRQTISAILVLHPEPGA